MAKSLIDHSLAASTRRSYAVGQSEFLRFCLKLGIPPFPASEPVLILFVAELSQRLCHSSVRCYLSAIRHWNISQGGGDHLAHSLRLQLALKGLRRKKPRSSDSHLPITPYILKRIKSVLTANSHQQDNIMLWAACLGFFAFLRSGEMTIPSADTFDPGWHLTPLDIAVDNLHQPSFMQVRLKGSKTDQTRRGVNLYVGRTFNDLCPVAAMLSYLAIRGFNQGPLFKLQNGSPLTRQKLVDLLRTTLTAAGINPSLFGPFVSHRCSYHCSCQWDWGFNHPNTGKVV